MLVEVYVVMSRYITLKRPKARYMSHEVCLTTSTTLRSPGLLHKLVIALCGTVPLLVNKGAVQGAVYKPDRVTVRHLDKVTMQLRSLTGDSIRRIVFSMDLPAAYGSSIHSAYTPAAEIEATSLLLAIISDGGMVNYRVPLALVPDFCCAVLILHLIKVKMINMNTIIHGNIHPFSSKKRH